MQSLSKKNESLEKEPLTLDSLIGGPCGVGSLSWGCRTYPHLLVPQEPESPVDEGNRQFYNGMMSQKVAILTVRRTECKGSVVLTSGGKALMKAKILTPVVVVGFMLAGCCGGFSGE